MIIRLADIGSDIFDFADCQNQSFFNTIVSKINVVWL